jgi:hypothetical protein
VSDRRLAFGLVLLLAACASGPPTPEWQLNARSAIDRAVAEYLAGDTRASTAELERARREVGRTGRVDLVARVELMHCAARVASLVLEPCEGFEKLRADAAPAERAYADYLAARLSPDAVRLLPPAQRGVAARGLADTAAAAALKGIEDPLSRLVAAGVLFRADRATPAVLELAVETASAQGWRRPLLAWLEVQRLRAEKAGDSTAAARLRREIEIVEQSTGQTR